MTYLNPEPHRKTFMKPFMTQQSAEFCSTCHKVHLDVPVNNYRWFRGFNDYDNWQASGFGAGRAVVLLSAEGTACADCHMPLVPHTIRAITSGQVHSHRFPAANTARAYANQDDGRWKPTEKFLKSGFISVDIFAASPVEDNGKQTAMVRRAVDRPAS